MLNTIMLLQILIANEVYAANKVGGTESGSESIEKYRKLLKTKKSSKSNKKLSKSKNQRPTSATEERNFLISDAKTDFRFWSNFI